VRAVIRVVKRTLRLRRYRQIGVEDLSTSPVASFSEARGVGFAFAVCCARALKYAQPGIRRRISHVPSVEWPSRDHASPGSSCRTAPFVRLLTLPRLLRRE
jgi:hypothetical protein